MTSPTSQIPDVLDYIIENITLSPYPGPGVIDEYPNNFDIETDNIGYMLYDELTELSTYTKEEATGDFHEGDNSLLECYWPDVMKELCKNDKPAGWIAHLKLSIVEVTA